MIENLMYNNPNDYPKTTFIWPRPIQKLGQDLLDFKDFKREENTHYGYLIAERPAGCYCPGCCAVMGWDKPKSAIVIYKRKFTEKGPSVIAEFDLDIYNKDDVIQFFEFTIDDTYHNMMNPQDNYSI